MAGRLPRVRRAAFVVALLVSAAVYAYSLSAIAGTDGELRSLVKAQSVERSTPVMYQPATEAHANCPDPADAHRVKL